MDAVHTAWRVLLPRDQKHPPRTREGLTNRKGDVNTSRLSSIHWKAPALMAGALTTGILLAVGHHLFYQSLDGRPIATENRFAVGRWSGMPPQKFNTSVGTTFAFLIKTCLALAVAAAYVQVLWKVLKAQDTKVATVDNMSSILENALALLDFSIWRRHHLLIALASIAWVIPIASVITPATLSVEIAPNTTWVPVNVSNVDFNSLNFASLPVEDGLSPVWTYTGPQFGVRKVVMATAVQGAILPIEPPSSAVNASYTHTFAGPALRCSEVTGALLTSITSNVLRASGVYDANGCETSYGYISWVPDIDGQTPFVHVSNSSSYILRPGTLGPMAGYDVPSTPMTLYVASFPSMQSDVMGGGCSGNADSIPNATVIQCQLYNTTYQGNFQWVNGVQSVHVEPSDSYSEVFVENSISGVQPLAAFLPNGTYVPFNPNSSASFNSSIVQTFAYQSVMDAFGELLTGTIANDRSSSGGLVTVNTSIMNTVLGDSRELSFLRVYAEGTSKAAGNTFQAEVAIALDGPGENYLWDGSSVTDNSTGTTELRSALETLFQNTTVSLMSSNLLQANRSSIYAPPPTNVTFVTYHSVYAYSYLTLWLAYGMAILFAAIAVAVGFVAMLANGVSYSNNFSTILRTASHAYLTASISDSDAQGQDPLPDHLAKATIGFPRASLQQKHGDVIEMTVRPKVADARSGLLHDRDE